jgi:endonuclease/exonuclease/phosphatase family metal-dependent hydrolase
MSDTNKKKKKKRRKRRKVRKQGEEFNVLTLNVWVRPPGICKNVFAQDRKDARLKLIARFLSGSNFDVVCLQEMFRFASTRRAKLIKHCSPTFPYSFGSTARGRTQPVDGGTLILSRHEIVGHGELPFPADTLAQSDRLTKKGIIYAAVRRGHERWIVGNMHAQAVYTPGLEPLVVRQLDFASRWARSIVWPGNGDDDDDAQDGSVAESSSLSSGGNDVAVLLVGDFNVPLHEEHLIEHLPAHKRCSTCACGVEFTFPTELGSSKREQTIDYIVACSDHIRIERASVLRDYGHLSDHFPVQATLTIPR